MNGDVKDILDRYQRKIRKQIQFDEYTPGPVISREYRVFREELTPAELTFYEKLCGFAEKIIKIKPKEALQVQLEKSIETAHLTISVTGAVSFAVLVAFLFILFALAYGVLAFVLTGTLKLFFPLVLLVAGVALLKPLSNLPNYLAARWRLRTSNQMVLCILYVVMYMRHTSNLEHALKFSTDHIGPPLSLDLRKVFWDIETKRFTTIKESLDHYLESWKDYNLEFVEAFHLIQSSLYEPSETRRVDLLEKSLDIILNGTYEKMLHYAHDLKNPVTMLHMLGIVLPILGLVIFPLVGSFLGGAIKWYHLAILYNIILPAIVFFFSTNILSKRPTGYGENELTELLPEFKELEKARFGGVDVKPVFVAVFILAVLGLIGLLPVLLHILNPEYDINLGLFGRLLDYQENNGPYGIGALLLSFFIPLGLALSIGIYYKIKTSKLIKIRDATKNLEREFAGSLFQLGNRLGDGIPAEIAFGKVAENLQGTPTGTFFSRVSINISKLGMGIQDAIFNKKVGAILLYPSGLIESSMRVLLESVKKGPQIASKSLLSISQYVESIHRVNERLRDLMADVIASMKSQISFLTPIIAGIVVGLAAMIVTIISRLGEQFKSLPAGDVAEFNIGALVNLFRIQDVIPSYYFQLVVGIYVVEITILLTMLSNGVENGADKLQERYLIGKNLYRSVTLYVIIALVVTFIFSLLARGILTGVQGI